MCTIWCTFYREFRTLHPEFPSWRSPSSSSSHLAHEWTTPEQRNLRWPKDPLKSRPAFGASIWRKIAMCGGLVRVLTPNSLRTFEPQFSGNFTGFGAMSCARLRALAFSTSRMTWQITKGNWLRRLSWLAYLKSVLVIELHLKSIIFITRFCSFQIWQLVDNWLQ